MSNNNDALPKADHDKILTDRVLRRADLTGSTSVEQPRAIILAGQPGAGKGGLTEKDKKRHARMEAMWLATQKANTHE
jgi:ATP-dependent 26S proteasome regulatory subunit